MKLATIFFSIWLFVSATLGPIYARAVETTVAQPMAYDHESLAFEPHSRESLFQIYYRDLYSPFVDPMTLSIFAGGTISTLTLLATHADFEDHVLENASTHRPLGDSSKFGDIMGQNLPNLLYFIGFGTDYWITKDPLAAYRAEMMFRSTIAAVSLSTVLKVTVREPRPGVPDELTSFPSGHSTSIFAFATTVAAMHGPYLGAGAYLLATFVAFSRMNDNRHRLHDVVAGATIGSMYGLSVYNRMREAALPSVKTAKSSFHYEVMPMATDDGAILGLAADF